MQKVKITWKAFGDKPAQGRFVSFVEVETNFLSTVTDTEICDIVYADTNRYQGYIWNLIQDLLDSRRTHTSISVGDTVEIDGRSYTCADIGWIKTENAVIEYLPSDYGINNIYSVKEKSNV